MPDQGRRASTDGSGVTALSDVLAVIAGRYLLGETIVATRWMGVCIITAGVVCIGLS